MPKKYPFKHDVTAIKGRPKESILREITALLSLNISVPINPADKKSIAAANKPKRKLKTAALLTMLDIDLKPFLPRFRREP